MARTFTLIFFMFFDAAVKLAGDSEVKGSLEPVRVLVGQDVILPCHLEPPFDVREISVDWSLGETVVHVYRNGKDDYAPQDERFKNRTFLFRDEMHKGNISLKLSSVNYTDAGNYTCYVQKLDSQVRRENIQLIVEAPTPHAENKGNGTEDGSNSVMIDIVIGCVIAGIAGIVIAVVRFMRRNRQRVQNERPNEGPNKVVVQQPNAERESMLKKKMQN